MKVECFEVAFIRLLHLLAHHPDFSNAHEDLVDFSKWVYLFFSFYLRVLMLVKRYIEFYIDLIANSETVSLLYHLAMKGKTVRIAESQGQNFSEVWPFFFI